MSIELFKERAAEGGFARADFAGELDETFAFANAEEEMVDGFAVLGAVK